MSVVGDKPNFTSRNVTEPAKPESQNRPDNELPDRMTLGQVRRHLDFLISKYGENTVVTLNWTVQP